MNTPHLKATGPRRYLSSEPETTRQWLQAHGWTPEPARGVGELWRVTRAGATACGYFSGLVQVYGADVDLLAEGGAA